MDKTIGTLLKIWSLDQHLMSKVSSVTRLGDILDFGQVFEALGNNYFV